jgi:hypothetical protein
MVLCTVMLFAKWLAVSDHFMKLWQQTIVRCRACFSRDDACGRLQISPYFIFW